MKLQRPPFVDPTLSKADIYTNLHGLQSIKTEANREQALLKIARQFESLFVNMMLKNMRAANAVFEKDSVFSGAESRFYRDLLDQQRSLTVAHGKGLGIADALYRQMARRYSHGENSPAGQGVGGFSRREALPSPPTESENIGRGDKPERVALAGSPREFIEKVLPYAKTAAKKLGVDHLLLVAQSALETGWGKHLIADENGNSSNNLFNIKRGSGWARGTVKKSTLEFSGGVMQKEQAEFRAYRDLAESFDDYVNFVSTNGRYQPALAQASDPQAFISGLHKAGYATDPNYSKKVMAVYEQINQFVSTLPDLLAAAEEEGP